MNLQIPQIPLLYQQGRLQLQHPISLMDQSVKDKCRSSNCIIKAKRIHRYLIPKSNTRRDKEDTMLREVLFTFQDDYEWQGCYYYIYTPQNSIRLPSFSSLPYTFKRLFWQKWGQNRTSYQNLHLWQKPLVVSPPPYLPKMIKVN